ncbi:MAG: HAMP domain-containing histidine kinase [Lachnospiraceae bacterium]|nr:HAMP domain-containing histidine kinase [Lachnospiraceae bacterium]
MKNRYGKIGRNMLLRSALISILAVAAGYGLLTFLTRGIGGETFQSLILKILQKLGMSEEYAAAVYTRLLINGKMLFVLGGFFLMFFIFFLLSLRRMVRYLNSVSGGLDIVLSESPESILLPGELEPMAEQLNELRRRLSWRAQQAVESEQRKNEMVVCLAHDLKTPLTSVTAYLTMLDEHPEMSQEERVKYTHITLEKAIRLEELMDEFFEITRFNAQDITLEKREINLSIMLEQLEDENYGLLNAKNMTCVVDVQEGLLMRGDPEQLARVFDNLLKNAAAYGNEGSQILIQARGGNGGITIVFTNEGPQIPQKKLEMIFEKFYRVDDGRSSKTGGAGLGLAIAKRIVEMHGGAISAVSDRKNTRFIVNVPVDAPAAKGESDEKEQKQRSRRKLAK